MSVAYKNTPDLYEKRRTRSGQIVRLIYGLSIILLMSILAWNFMRGFLFLEGTGTITAKKNIISFSFPVRITDIFVSAGSDVKKGELIARIESFEIDQAATRIKIQISELNIKLAEFEIRYKVAKETEIFAQRRASMTRDIFDKLERLSTEASSSQYRMQVYLERSNAEENYVRLTSEIVELQTQIDNLKTQIENLKIDLNKITSILLDGDIHAEDDYVVGTGIPDRGQVYESGINIFTLYDRKELFVIWEVPLRRFVDPAIGDLVYINSGYSMIEGHVDAIFPLSTAQGANRSLQFTGIFQGQTAIVRNRGFDNLLPIDSQVVVRMNYMSALNKVFNLLLPRNPR